MNETQRICQQWQQAFEGNAWHGPSVKEVLHGVNAERASAKPLPSAHSIWEIVLHLMGTQKLLLRRLDGDAGPLSAEEDWPGAPEPTDEAWTETLAQLERQEVTLRTRVLEYPVDRLDQPLAEGGSSAYNNFHGYAQHHLYHGGQIALLKKQLTA